DISRGVVACQPAVIRGAAVHDCNGRAGILGSEVSERLLRGGGSWGRVVAGEGGSHPGMDEQRTTAAGNERCQETLPSRSYGHTELPTTAGGVWKRYECFPEPVAQCGTGDATAVAAHTRTDDQARGSRGAAGRAMDHCGPDVPRNAERCPRQPSDAERLAKSS